MSGSSRKSKISCAQGQMADFNMAGYSTAVCNDLVTIIGSQADRVIATVAAAVEECNKRAVHPGLD